MRSKKKWTRNQKIMVATLVVAGVLVPVVLHFWPRKDRVDRSVDTETVLSKVIEEAERKGQADEQINQLKGELAKALERVSQLEAQGNRPDATKALDEVRKIGDTSRLLELLIKERDKYRDGLIQRNHEIAAVAYLRGDIDVAESAVDEVLRLEPNDVIALTQRGHICRLRGNLDEAEKAYLRVKELGDEAGNQKWESGALGNLGLIYETRGQLDKAEEMFRESLKISEAQGMLELTANQYGNLGLIYSSRGDLDQAEEMHKKSLEIEKKLGHLEGMASDYGNLGVIYRRRGDLDQAEKMFREGLKIDEKLSRLEGMAAQYGNLGLIYEQRGDIDKARQYWEKAADLFKKIGMRPEVEKVQGWIEGLEETQK